ncbi:hypothetical protein BpHYR1_027391 [Brachionus plicatilis]|uniref:Uncharacterized protein n=1 Tax=Brachionus plicatilis TaxID=10195 RepID=A0A3M7P509_BRAPC|nr:hypothetical protein BpHYR1_027391 [Brachionus plicatilis]
MLKICIEGIINLFKFNKIKIVVCDEGSNIVRLIGQLEKIDFVSIENNEEDLEGNEENNSDNYQEEDEDGEEDEDLDQENTITNIYQYNAKLGLDKKSLSGNTRVEPYEYVPQKPNMILIVANY